jgi:hypothetical protein
MEQSETIVLFFGATFLNYVSLKNKTTVSLSFVPTSLYTVHTGIEICKVKSGLYEFRPRTKIPPVSLTYHLPTDKWWCKWWCLCFICMNVPCVLMLFLLFLNSSNKLVSKFPLPGLFTLAYILLNTYIK